MDHQTEYLAIHKYRLDYIFDQIKKLNLPKDANVLDVGCFPPFLFDKLAVSYQTYGISSPNEPVANKNVFTLNIETDRINIDKKFDLIIFTEILEHLTNPYLVLKKLIPLIKSNGYLLITTPNITRLQNLVLLFSNKNIYFPLFQLEQPINFRHQREYSLPEVVQIGQSLALKIEKSFTFTAYPPFRPKNKTDGFTLKTAKYINYFLTNIFKSRRDSLFVLFRK